MDSALMEPEEKKSGMSEPREDEVLRNSGKNGLRGCTKGLGRQFHSPIMRVLLGWRCSNVLGKVKMV